MRHIDAFCHFFPPRLFEKMSRTAGESLYVGYKRVRPESDKPSAKKPTS